jgi:hypothetical protein
VEGTIAACRRIQLEGQTVLTRILAIAFVVVVLGSIAMGFLLHNRARMAEELARNSAVMAEHARMEAMRDRDNAERELDAARKRELQLTEQSASVAKDLATVTERLRTHGVAELPVDAAGWRDLFNVKPDDWRHGLATAQKLARLPGDRPIEILEEIWSGLSVPAREQLMKPFVFDPPHASVLRVLQLAALDAELSVRERAWQYLRSYALEDFSLDPVRCEAWLRAQKGRSLAETLEQSLREFATRQSGLSGPQAEVALELLARSSPAPWRVAGVGRTALMREVGLVDRLRSTALAGSDEGRKALEALATLDFGEAEQRDIFLPWIATDASRPMSFVACSAIGKPGNTWAVRPLLDYLDRALAEEPVSNAAVFAATRALGEIGDRSEIPTLIARIEARENYSTVYGIGYFALGKLTGVSYHESHGASFWAQWHAQNKSK